RPEEVAAREQADEAHRGGGGDRGEQGLGEGPELGGTVTPRRRRWRGRDGAGRGRAALEDGSAHRPRHADAARRVAGWAITWFHASRNDRPAVTHTSRPNAGTRSRRAAGAADSYADRSNSTSESDP